MEEKKLIGELACDPKETCLGRIVGTIGPASQDNLETIIEYGTIRMNMAFMGEHNYEEVLGRIKRIRDKGGNRINIMLDAVGPRVKLGRLPVEGVLLVEGESLIITTDQTITATPAMVSTIFLPFLQCVKPGHKVLLAEGKYLLLIQEILNETQVKCKVVIGGLLKKRGINLPDSNLNVPSLSDADVKGLKVLLKEDQGAVDTIALSFVRNTQDIHYLRNFLKEVGREDVRIMAKIETQDAIDNIISIAQESDSLMIARGDLWCELSNAWSLPRVTLEIISAGRFRGIPVIAATQTLSSMVESEIPSRAEVDELYFLIREGADCIMGSEEFAIGKNPRSVVNAIKTMAREVALEAAHELAHGHKIQVLTPIVPEKAVQFRAAKVWAESSSRVQCIVIISHSGFGLRQMYKQRPYKPIVAISNNGQAIRYFQQFNCYPVLVKHDILKDDPVKIALEGLSALKWESEGKTALLCFRQWINGQDYIMVQEIPMP